LRTVLAVKSIRSVNNAPTKVESEIRYFLSSCPDGPAVLGQAIRSHWAVENALHWVLDVTFSGEPLGSTREDDSRVRDRTAARNLALLRKIALNIVGRDKTTKASVRARRKKAAWNDAYMLKLLVGRPMCPVQYRHEISCVPPLPAKPGYDKHVVVPHLVEQPGQLGAVALHARQLLLEQPPAACPPQRPALEGEVLVFSADAGVAEEHGTVAEVVAEP